MKSKRVWFSLTAVALVTITAFASKKVAPPERSHIVGAWCGYTDGAEFLRLELDDDGTGFLGVTFVPGNPARLYRIPNWRYSDWSIELAARAIDSDAEGIVLTNIVCGYETMDCVFGGTAGWKRKAKLFNEREWNAQVQPLRDRIAHYRKGKK
jgi:hypothetical protein